MNKEQREEYIYKFGQPNESPKYSFSFLDIVNMMVGFMFMVLFFGMELTGV
jgi:hypothetical protein